MLCIIFKDKFSCFDYRMYIIGADKYYYPCDRCMFNTNKK